MDKGGNRSKPTPGFQTNERNCKENREKLPAFGVSGPLDMKPCFPLLTRREAEYRHHCQAWRRHRRHLYVVLMGIPAVAVRDWRISGYGHGEESLCDPYLCALMSISSPQHGYF